MNIIHVNKTPFKIPMYKEARSDSFGEELLNVKSLASTLYIDKLWGCFKYTIEDGIEIHIPTRISTLITILLKAT